MIVRLDARRLTDLSALHAVLAETFGFPANYGKNLDAQVDGLTHLDNPQTALSRVQALPGQPILLVLDHAGQRGDRLAETLPPLQDVIAFVNWRRLERGQPPVLALAYERT